MMLYENVAQWITLAVFSVTAALALWRLWREKKGAQAEELARLDQVQATLTGLLQGAMCGLVTAAEREFGQGKGVIKKSAVLAELLRLLPEDWRGRFDAQALEALIESGLCDAKAHWSTCDGLASLDLYQIAPAANADISQH